MFDLIDECSFFSVAQDVENFDQYNSKKNVNEKNNCAVLQGGEIIVDL